MVRFGEAQASFTEFLRVFFAKNRYLRENSGTKKISRDRQVMELAARLNFRTSKEFIKSLETGKAVKACSVYFLTYIALYWGMTLNEYCEDLYSGKYREM